MEYLLLGVIMLLILYVGYQDFANRQEREKLELKLMSKNVTEYTVAVEPQPEPLKDEPEEHVDLDDIDPKKLLTAKDHL